MVKAIRYRLAASNSLVALMGNQLQLVVQPYVGKWYRHNLVVAIDCQCSGRHYCHSTSLWQNYLGYQSIVIDEAEVVMIVSSKFFIDFLVPWKPWDGLGLRATSQNHTRWFWCNAMVILVAQFRMRLLVCVGWFAKCLAEIWNSVWVANKSGMLFPSLFFSQVRWYLHTNLRCWWCIPWTIGLFERPYLLRCHNVVPIYLVLLLFRDLFLFCVLVRLLLL